MGRRIVILGSSHTRAIAKAAEGIEDVTVHWVIGAKDSVGDMTQADAVELASSLKEGDVLAITWSGTYHNIFGLLESNPPLDFMDQVDDHIDPNRLFIPYGLIKDQFASVILSDRFTSMIAKTTKAKIVLLPAPPIKDNDHVAGAAKEYRGAVLAERGITPARVRAKMWRVELACLKDLAETVGGVALAAPDGTMSDQGLLKLEFYAGDATHANAHYGAPVIEQIRQLVH